ncbi:unnamed protein product [Caenorhabditis brenneri]
MTLDEYRAMGSEEFEGRTDAQAKKWVLCLIEKEHALWCRRNMPYWAKRVLIEGGSNALPICMAIGKPILENTSWVCRRCKHHVNKYEIKKWTYCPLCHDTEDFNE